MYTFSRHCRFIRQCASVQTHQGVAGGRRQGASEGAEAQCHHVPISQPSRDAQGPWHWRASFDLLPRHCVSRHNSPGRHRARSAGPQQFLRALTYAP